MTTIIILLLISITSVLIIKSLSKKKDVDYIQPNVKEKIEPTPRSEEHTFELQSH